MNKQRIGLLLIGLVGLALAASGVGKLMDPTSITDEILPENLRILGIIELIIVVCLALRPTRLLGVILAASYIGGIIAFSWLVEGETPLVGIALNVVLYAGAALYRPWLTKNVTGLVTPAA